MAAAFVGYLPFVLTDRAAFGVALSNMQLLTLGLTQINLMVIAMLMISMVTMIMVMLIWKF